MEPDGLAWITGVFLDAGLLILAFAVGVVVGWTARGLMPRHY